MSNCICGYLAFTYSVAMWGMIHLVQFKRKNPTFSLVSAEKLMPPVCSAEQEVNVGDIFLCRWLNTVYLWATLQCLWPC